jgi:hypothetical protein
MKMAPNYKTNPILIEIAADLRFKAGMPGQRPSQRKVLR